ncbi:MAG: response regulator [Bacteroidota bacterium]
MNSTYQEQTTGTLVAIHNILLAEDDSDDQYLFKYVLESLKISFTLTIVTDGEELMKLLSDESNSLPDILFLDLNMPRKNGAECLVEIKKLQHLRQLPIVICSTAREDNSTPLLHENGAKYYLMKPDQLSQFKQLVKKAIEQIKQTGNSQPPLKDFMLTI